MPLSVLTSLLGAGALAVRAHLDAPPRPLAFVGGTILAIAYRAKP